MSSRLDFYLPPPDDRAYRWGKIQRMRDQITMWRPHAKRHAELSARDGAGGSAAAAATTTAVELPRWRKAAVSPSRRCLSRHEKLFLQSLVTESWQQQQQQRRGRTAPAGRITLPCASKDTKTKPSTATITGVTEVPYFHDRTIFCLPNEGRDALVTDDSSGDQAEQGVRVCYGVTSNTAELQSRSAALSCGGTTCTAKSNASSQAVPPLNHTAPVPPSEAATKQDHMIDASFAVKTQSVELAMSVHAERVRRRSSVRRPRSDSVRRRTFSRTAEVPIDWGEFGRLSAAGGGGSGCGGSGSSSNVTSMYSVPQPPGHCGAADGAPAATDGMRGQNTMLGGKGPMRLYAIRMKRYVSNSEGSTEKAAGVPRIGVPVELPASWSHH
ncbi:hypothetical protein DQ04_07851000 [Trypanosoma grayi]|uniref:hypothetical protein n=1 Tax=Trypanosoma grayi TaxID=71804 RepID=UPI0004F46677|nr:hypothetical protein DQ04_07851000 [Trypanosoma grayi]KEG08162.1 hypothetical protein DQ04_07851000 [Trypanosoma grayi]